MAFARPSLSELITRVRADIASAAGLVVEIPRRSVEDVLGRVLAGLAHGLHGHLAWVVAQILPTTAEEVYLLQWARLCGLAYLQPTAAGGIATFSSSDVDVPLGTRAKSDAGIEYEIVASAAPGGGTTTVAVQAVVAGEEGNLDAGETLTLSTPVAGVDSEGLVSFPGLTGGADLETIEQLRARVLARLAQGNGCGAPGDYEAWARATPDVRIAKAWERPERSGSNSVDVFVTVEVSGDPDLVNPSTEQLASVQAYLDEVVPVTVATSALAPTQQAVDLTLTALTPDTADVRAAIEAELTALFYRESKPGATIRLSHLREAISGAEGEVDFTMSSPSANVAASSDAHLPVLGTITWPT